MSRTTRKLYTSYSKTYDSTRDSKKWYKPNKKFKKLQKQGRKAKERDALRHILDSDDKIIPEFKKTDVWDWN